MKLSLVAAGCAASLALAGCANTSGASNLLNTIAVNYAHCERTVNYSASVGAMNPGSGAQVQGTIHCPALLVGPTGEPLPAAQGTTGVITPSGPQ